MILRARSKKESPRHRVKHMNAAFAPLRPSHARILGGLFLLLAAAAALASNVTYTYDAQGKLETATYDNGTTVSYSYDANGNRQSTVSVRDTAPPAAVSGLSATATSTTQINLAWTASSDNIGIANYRIERCQGVGCSSWSEFAQTSSTSYPDVGRTPSTAYSYRVRATDLIGNFGGYSNVASATTPADSIAPTVPTSLTATAVSSVQIDLTWGASVDTGGAGLAGYKVERCTGAACTNYTQIATPTTNGYSDTGRAPNTTYRYRVRAYDHSNNNSAFTGVLNRATPPDSIAPPVPGSFTATVGSSTRINLNWTAVVDSGGAGLTGYKLERCQGPGCTDFAQFTTQTDLTYAHVLLAASTTYRYRIRSYDNAGNHSDYSPIAEGTTLPDTANPTLPTNLLVTASSSTQIDLTWSASTDAGGSGLAGYQVQRCQGAACTNYVQIGTSAVNSYQDSGRAPSTTYRYRVRAYDNAGRVSSFTAVVNATTPADTTPPATPAGLIAQVISASQITLSWTATNDTGGAGLTGYKLERCTGVGCSTFTQIAAPAGTSHPDTGLTSGTTYRYRVRAYDGNNNHSGYSSVVDAVATPDVTAPSTPTGFSVAVTSSTALTLTWTASTDSGGSQLTGYRIERCLGVGCSNFALLATPSANPYPDTGLAANTTYLYRVRAYDGAGNNSSFAGPVSGRTQVDTTPPSVPTNVSATVASSTQINISWSASTEAGGSTLTGYALERCSGTACSNYAEIGRPSGTSYPDTGRAPNTFYSYRVRSYDSANNHSSFAFPVSATTPGDTDPPTTPGSLQVTTASMSQLTLAWGASIDTGGSLLAGYRVERCTGAGCSSFTQIGTTGTTSYPDPGLPPSTTYTYRVRAYDNAGNTSGYTSPAQGTSGADSQPPTAPGQPAFSSATSTSVTVSWTGSTDNVGVAGYDYQMNGGSWTSSGASTSVAVSGLSPGVGYTFVIRARDAANNTTVSSPNTFTPVDNVAPSAPGTPVASGVSFTSMTVSWSAASDNVAVTGYQYRLGTSGAFTSAGAATSVALSSLAANTAYVFQVQARDAAGNWGAVSQATVTTQSPTVTLISNDGGAEVGPGGSTVHYSVQSNGEIWKPNTNNVFAYGSDWLTPKLGMGTFEARATIVSGSSCLGGTYGTWLLLSTTRTWTTSVSGTRGASNSCMFTLEIRNPATGVVVTSNVHISAVGT